MLRQQKGQQKGWVWPNAKMSKKKDQKTQKIMPKIACLK